MRKLILLLLLAPFLGYAQVSSRLTVEDVWSKYLFYPNQQKEITPLKDGKTYAQVSKGKSNGDILVRYSYASGKPIDTLIHENDLPNIDLSNFSFNPSENKILLEKDIESIYRRSSKGNFSVYDLHSHTLLELSSKGKQQEATFSPDGTKVAFVRENNLFYVDLSTGKEIQVSTDGKKNSIIIGITDWVYEEEFEFTRAYFWSPDNKKIAYYRFDESKVPEFTIVNYNDLYPSLYTYKYPKAGEKNSEVSIQVFNLTTQRVTSPNIDFEKDQYIPRIRWTEDPNTLCIYRLNRHQNNLEYLLANSTTGETSLLIALKDKKYVDISKNDDLTFLPGNQEFILSHDQSGYLHYYRYSMKGKLLNPITKGNWDVSKLYGVNKQKGILYFQASIQNPTQRDIFSIGLNGKNLQKISPEQGWNSAEFSSDYSYFMLTYSTLNLPPKISIMSSVGKSLQVIEDNKNIVKATLDFKFQPFEFMTIPVSGVNLNAWIIKPRDFISTKKYPVLMYVYGGPGSQTVEDKFDGFDRAWYQILADKGYIVLSVDGRGTGQRGAEFEKITYLNLGKYEAIDQIEAAKWLSKQSYVDPKRIGIWGWSFGGYLSSICITKGNDVFKTAIAVAPVTNWRYYDSIYTERYMTSPEENPSGYDDNSPVNFSDRLKGNFLLIHGTADDNVHLQNSIMFSESLIQKNKKFSQAYYPNKNHGIFGGNTRNHLYTKMTDFIVENL